MRLLVLSSLITKTRLEKGKNACCKHSFKEKLHRMATTLSISKKCFFDFMSWKMTLSGRNVGFLFFLIHLGTILPKIF